MMQFLSQRAFLALFIFLLLSCSRSAEREWIYEGLLVQRPDFCSGRLFLPPESDTNPLELEINRTVSGVRMYINILFLQAPPSAQDPSRTIVQIIIPNQNQSFTICPTILQGGQRLLVDDQDADQLTEMLLNGEAFVIQMGYYSTLVTPVKFNDLYRQMNDLPIE